MSALPTDTRSLEPEANDWRTCGRRTGSDSRVALPNAHAPRVTRAGPELVKLKPVLGSGNPWVTRGQSSGSVLVESGNPERDIFILDLGSGSLAN
jgi:hypothetical protein